MSDALARMVEDMTPEQSVLAMHLLTAIQHLSSTEMDKKRGRGSPVNSRKRPCQQPQAKPATLTQFLLQIARAAEEVDTRKKIVWPEVTSSNIPQMLQLAAEKCSSLLTAPKASDEHDDDEGCASSAVSIYDGNAKTLEGEAFDAKDKVQSGESLSTGQPFSEIACPSPSSLICIQKPSPVKSTPASLGLPALPSENHEPLDSPLNMTLPAIAVQPPSTFTNPVRQHRSLYADEIMVNMLAVESHFIPNPCYLTEVQTEITEWMRAVLVDWIFEVCEQFEFFQETFSLTVNLVDRYLSVHAVQRSDLQLVGVAACFLASKLEERFPPSADQFLFISANTYTMQELVCMEHSILNTLHFRCNAPTPVVFLGIFQFEHQVPPKVMSTALFLAQASACSTKFLAHHPSVIASSCLSLAGSLHDIKLHHSGGPPDDDLIAGLRLFIQKMAASKLTTIISTFRTLKYHHAADTVCSRLAGPQS